MRRTPTCVLSDAAPPDVSDGHAVDRFVEIGSLTKVVTGTALARMATSGVVGLDDPLERWLPATPRTGITLLHLAQHTSGLPRLPPRVSRRDPYATFDRRAVHQLLSRLDAIAARPPGRQEEYSNLGYAILGEALATAAGTTYEELVTEYVLRPLDIAEVTANPDPSRRLPATGRFGRPRRPWTMHGAILPAGGLWATPARQPIWSYASWWNADWGIPRRPGRPQAPCAGTTARRATPRSSPGRRTTAAGY